MVLTTILNNFIRESSSKNFVTVYIEPFRQRTKEVHMVDDLQDYGGTGLKKERSGSRKGERTFMEHFKLIKLCFPFSKAIGRKLTQFKTNTV